MRGSAGKRQLLFDGEPTGVVIYEADSFASRFLGLMGTRELPEGNGLLLVNCGQIHCCFMRYPLKIVYFDDNFNALTSEIVKPWHMGKRVKGARHVLEIQPDALPEVDIRQLRIA